MAVYPRRSSTADFLLFRLRYDRGSDSSYFPTAAPYTLFQMHAPDFVEAMREKLHDPDWGLILEKQHFYLFKRGASPTVDQGAANAAFESEAAEFLAAVQSRYQFRTPTFFVAAVMIAALLSTCSVWKLIDTVITKKQGTTAPRSTELPPKTGG
ncbi:MAG: hypothetical protein O2960_29780 [Verrucomicrobia bacterium]|nr:hypothetical protein [Verrucomicrobiota bacterium]